MKVISYDRLIRDTDAVDYYVTFDSMAVGAAWSQYLIEQAGSTKGNPLYLYTGAASDNNAFIFFEGAWETIQPKIADGTFVIKNSSEAVALKDKPTLTRDEEAKIIGQITTNWDFNTAKNLAESNLTMATAADKGTVYILAPNDGTARAIADAFAADKDVTKYFVTGQDAEKASVQYIIDGKQSMTVLKDVRTLAADAVTAANAFLAGGTPDEDQHLQQRQDRCPGQAVRHRDRHQGQRQAGADRFGLLSGQRLHRPGSRGAAPADKAAVGVVLPTKDEPRWLQDQAVLPEGGLRAVCSARATAPRKRRTSKR